jgi:hypothetical protein
MRAATADTPLHHLKSWCGLFDSFEKEMAMAPILKHTSIKVLILLITLLALFVIVGAPYGTK